MMHFLNMIFKFIMSYLTTTVLAVEKQDDDDVIILHGITRSSSHMGDLKKALQKQGYDVINLDYPSTN